MGIKKSLYNENRLQRRSNVLRALNFLPLMLCFMLINKIVNALNYNYMEHFILVVKISYNVLFIPLTWHISIYEKVI